MKRSGKGRGKTPKQRPSTVEEGAAWLRAYTIAMFDQGDGRGVDWPVIAQTAFAAAFSVLDEAKGDDRAMKVLRRVEISLYERLAQTHDDTLPHPLGMGPAPAAKPLPPHRLPEPRNRP